MIKEKIIAQGAEAILVLKGEEIIKRRISKGYRHPDLDKKLRQQRTRREAKIIDKASKTINVPKLIKVDEKSAEITMELIPGKRLNDYLEILSLKDALKVCFDIGSEVGLLHNMGLIHGDLTTSNMILREKKLALIDFGLGFHSARAEDKAVDLRLLHQSLNSRHFKHAKEYFEEVLKGYRVTNKQYERVLEQLKKVESRGRYKGKTKRKQPMVV